MSFADRTFVSSLALSLALSGPLAAQDTPLTRDALPEAAKARFDALLAACEANGALPPGMESITGELNCDSILEIAENDPPGADGDQEETETVEDAGAEDDAATENAESASDAEAAVEADPQQEAATEAPAAEEAGGGDRAAEADPAAGAETEQTTEAQGEASAEAEGEVEGDTAVEAEAAPADDAEAETDAEPAESAEPTDEGNADEAATPADADDPAEETEPTDTAEPAASSDSGTDTADTTDAGSSDTPSDDPAAASESEADGDVDAETLEDALDQPGTDATEADGTSAAEDDATAGEDTGDTTAGQADTADESDQEAADGSDYAADPQDVEPMDSQAQADAVADSDDEAPAAAAAESDDSAEAEPEVTEEVVEESAVRESSQDFSTSAGGEARAEDDGDDDDNTLRNAALLGLGAIALNEILGADERVVSNTGDRVVVEDGGQLRILRNDDVLLRRPGAEVQTYSYQDGSTRQVITYEDGTTVETVRAANGRVLRRTRILPDGQEIVLFDDTRQAEAVRVNELPQATERRQVDFGQVGEDQLAAALRANEAQGVNRSFSLSQIRNIDAVRELVPQITVDSINFETASAAIRPSEAQELAALGNAMRRMIEENPNEVFLVEGHTDAVGGAAYNLALSDRRAESVALALTEYFDVPPSNMVLQGYGESDLLVQTQEAERRNRRAAVRRITPLLR